MSRGYSIPLMSVYPYLSIFPFKSSKDGEVVVKSSVENFPSNSCIWVLNGKGSEKSLKSDVPSTSFIVPIFRFNGSFESFFVFS